MLIASKNSKSVSDFGRPPWPPPRRTPMLASDGASPPSQSASHPPDMSRWNPFGEDNFSKLTEEELIDREFDLLRASK